jgi:predicted RNA-binding protein YlxR (DUF448 family)
MGKRKHIPIRTCVACRETDEKRDLMRIVRQPDGSVCYDPKGKISGRGAYVCTRTECVTLAQKRKQLERSLKVSGIPPVFYAELIAYATARASVVANPGDAVSNAVSTDSSIPVETIPPAGSTGQMIGRAAMPPVMLKESEGETI